MIPLIKIRGTYLKRNIKTCIFGYLSMPFLIIFISVFYNTKKGKEPPTEIDKKKKFIYDSDFYLFKNQNYTELQKYMLNTSLVAENPIGDELVKYIREKTDITVNLYSNEDQIGFSSQNIIILDYKDNKYKFTFKEKEIIKDNVTFDFPFDTKFLSSEKASEVFDYSISYIQTEKQNKHFFLYQSFLANFLIQYEKKTIKKDLHFTLGLNSYPPRVKVPKDYTTVEPIVGYSFALQFSFIFLMFSIQMLEEKEQKLELLLERLGISSRSYISSWLINYIIVGVFADLACIISSFQILKCFYALIFVNLILYNLAQFSMMYFIVSISQNKKTGIILINLLGFGSLIIGYVLNMGNLNKFFQIIMNLFPNINIFLSTKLIIKLQNFGEFSWVGLRLSYNKISYLETFICFVAESVLFLCLSLFIKAYKKSGLNFISFIKSFFVKINREIDNGLSKDIINNPINDNFVKNHEELTEINKSLKSEKRYLDIRNVTRKYGELIAVNNFSGELYKNEIFCLLGHNGAGKTTLIKMISGSEDPDNGDIFLNNISVVTDKNYLYHNIGLCQQENIFFDYLTVIEHLKYMVEIKGLHGDMMNINTLITKIGLKEKENAICKNLSGGEKRKLCIALALIGDSQLVLLDEPTSGMDVMAKRALWDFLKEYKTNRIIILTTHSLDEAEYLGDRIGIMNNGDFICSGTSSYLKSKYPCGFNINLLLNPAIFNENYKQQLYNQLIKYEPNLEVKISSKGLFSINIQSNNNNIKEIFDVIENNKNEYGIEDYTVSSTSLEDVFLKLNHKIILSDENNETIDMKDSSFPLININKASFFPQLKSHTKRGFYSLWRNKCFSLLELMMGLFVIYIYVLLYYVVLEQQAKRTLSFTQLLNYNDIFICKDNRDFFESSYVYKDLASVNSQFIDKKNNKDDFIEEIYQNSVGNIGKSGICVLNLNEENKDYEIFNTEIPMDYPGYIMANTLFTVSAFLKKEYNIDAAIFDKIENLRYNDNKLTFGDVSIMISLCFGSSVSLSIYLATIIAEKIRERTKNIKHILFLSGTNMVSYWSGFYIVDIIKMLVFSSLVASSIYLINNFATYIWVDLIIVSYSCLFFVYCLSFFFEKEESGQKALSFFIFVVLIIIVIVILINVVLGKGISIQFMLNDYNFTLFDITPLTSFMLSSIRITLSYLVFKPYGDTSYDVINLYGLGWIYRPKNYVFTSIMINVINTIFYLSLLILLETGKISQLWNYIKVKYIIKESNITFSNEQMSEEFSINNNIQEDTNTPLLGNDNNNIQNNNNQLFPNNNINRTSTCVQNEINKINNDHENKLTTKIIALKKTYWLCCRKNVRAINNLYLGLENNEKFGLLGFNGSGKTTTFKSITKEILYDSGEIILFGYNNKTQFNEIRQSIGYCPQENPLFDYMKVKEIIHFYLELKGINESVAHICEKFGLEQYLDTYCMNLSGGNKRKLSFAISLMCSPKILLLDEPSTGVDPESRRTMWKNIMELSKKNKQLNMILSTHSMEEAEVLCDTVSWLKSGNFLSIGNPEKLKITLSAGYKLHIKFIQLNQNNQDIIMTEEIGDEFLEQISQSINGLNNFYGYIKKNSSIKPYLNELIKVIDSIKDKTSKLTLHKINKDLSFDFNIDVLKEKQSELFIQVLDMKNTNNLLSEISISMESLENVLTKL